MYMLLFQGCKVEVKEPPQGVTPPSSVQGSTKKPTVQPSRLRRFVAKNSAGLRIRAHPSLQSEQIGIVHINGTIAFIDEVRSPDLLSNLLIFSRTVLLKESLPAVLNNPFSKSTFFGMTSGKTK